MDTPMQIYLFLILNIIKLRSLDYSDTNILLSFLYTVYNNATTNACKKRYNDEPLQMREHIVIKRCSVHLFIR